MNKYFRKLIDEPTMSDKTLLMSVEDLINNAFGTLDQNVINFKLVQTILHILARQMRLLEQDVEIKLDDLGVQKLPLDAYEGDYEHGQQYTSSRGSKEEVAGEARPGRGDREARAGGRDRRDVTSPRGEGEEMVLDKADKGRTKDMKGGSKEKEGKGRVESPTKKDKASRGEKDRKERDRGTRGDLAADRDDDREGGGRGRAEASRGSPEPGSRGRAAGRDGSLTSITVTEAARKGGKGGQDKILVVGKSPAAHGTGAGGRVARVGSIEVVTASQFALLEKAVQRLATVAGPLPMPSLPDNERLRQDLAKGTATLSDTMEAMQLNARVQAAEKGLARMAELLTQLAAAGALPEDMAGRISEVQAELFRNMADIAVLPSGASAGYPGAVVKPGGVAVGPGGVAVGPGGVIMGPGGVIMGPGGVPVGSGGVSIGPGGVMIGPGGALVGPGGVTMGPGGVMMAPGGVMMGPGGVPVGPGGVLMGPDGVPVGSGGVTIGPGGVMTGPGGVTIGPGGVMTGPGGVTIGPGGVMTGPGGVTMGPGGVMTGPGGVPIGPGGVTMGPGGVLTGPDGVPVGPGGITIGPGGVMTGPGGVPIGSGGVMMGPGGVMMGPGGVMTGPGGATMGPGGVLIGPGGVPIAPGGVMMGPGGVPVGPGGVMMGPDGVLVGSGGVTIGPGGVMMGPDGVPVRSGGVTIGPGGVMTGPGGVPIGPGGVMMGPGGVMMGPGGVMMGPGGVPIGSGGVTTVPGSYGVGPGGVALGPGGVPMGPGAVIMGPGGVMVGPGSTGVRPGGATFGPDGLPIGGPGIGQGGVRTGGGTSQWPEGTLHGPGQKDGSGPPSDRKVGIDTTTPRPESGKRGKEAAAMSPATALSLGGPAGPGDQQIGAPTGITQSEMDEMLQIMKEELAKEITTVTARATHFADVASNTSKSVADKMDIAMKIDKRVTKLFAQTADYAEQLSGFDSGLTTQMASFQEQMSQMRSDLKAGMDVLEQANNNAETAAVLDLTERYEGLVIDLDNTLHAHQGLTVFQRQLTDELRSLVECVEMLREQKADRDEVLDGLRDKADITRLTGLLHEEDFARARSDLEDRIEKCYDKFNKQDQVWMEAIKDLTGISECKAEVIQLMAIKDATETELRDMQLQLRDLFIMLGEPKAALLMRELARGAACASCLTPALMVPVDPQCGQPARLPALRLPPLGEEQPCHALLKPLAPPDDRHHVCRRWVGGSHTLMMDNVRRERATPTHMPSVPTKRFTGYGADGRLYLLEEELEPCSECNQFSPEVQEVPQLLPSPAAGGDADRAAITRVTEGEEGDEKGKGGHMNAVSVVSEPLSQRSDQGQHPLRESVASNRMR